MGYYEEAVAAFRRGETDIVEQLSRREAERARAAGEPGAEVEALCMLARVAIRAGDLPGARRLALEARAVGRAAGDHTLERTPTHILAASARVAGDHDAARALYAESIALNRTLGDSRMVVVEEHNLAYVELRTGDLDQARTLFAAARRQTLRDGHDDLLPYITLDAAVMAAADGDFARAVRFLAALDSALRAIGQILDPDDAVEQEQLRERLVAELGQDAYDTAYEQGAAPDLRRILAA